MWTEPVEPKWDLIELFAGAANVSKVFREQGKRVFSFERDNGGAAMDMLESAGFLLEPYFRMFRSFMVELGWLLLPSSAQDARSYSEVFESDVEDLLPLC